MMKDRIGTMGKTHGVKDSPNPSSTNRGMITSSLPAFSDDSIVPISEPTLELDAAGGMVLGATDMLGVDCGVSMAGLPPDMPRAASRKPLPPPGARRCFDSVGA